MKNLLGYHPVTFVVALAAFVIWMLGNLRKNKNMVKIGIYLTVAAAIIFLIGF